MKETFVTKRFNKRSTQLITWANQILTAYRAQGYILTLRQLYYQFVSRDLIPNTVQSYKSLGAVISDARDAGLVDWAMIEDRNRETVIPPHWDSPEQIVHAAADSYRIDKWEDQDYHLEIMFEKDALSGIFEPVCNRLDVGCTANKGYSSASQMYRTAKRIEEKICKNKTVVLAYFGDHDPSGMDMTRDVRERLSLYSWNHVEVERLALNYEQIEAWNPPPNPAKDTDSRYTVYMAEFGDTSWELDAVEPTELVQLVEDFVLRFRDEDRWNAKVAEEEEVRSKLADVAERFERGEI